ncbi:MAG: hypothetical protein EZS28_010474 [Streblomastix strix]|uniref:Uncharacterized protein n=1 Tax=Streblomastix strix TaxID=222440 RepID=A0A5J4WI05_9EUKA|nr:MAG: hypothetical protein EZS28_010474 [Streblomastix strix]
MDYNHISPQHDTPTCPFHNTFNDTHHNPYLKKHQLYQEQIPQEIDTERKQPKLQQYAGRMDVVERFHEIMKPIIEQKMKNPKIIFLVQYQEFPNKDDPDFFNPPKNYRPTPIPRLKDLNHSEEQRNQFDGDMCEAALLLSLANRQP